MKRKSVDEFTVPSAGLLFVLCLWSATSNAVVSAGGNINFQLPDGDNVTCIPIEDQTSLVNTSLHWNRYPTTEITPGSPTNDTHGSKLAHQTIAEATIGCPNGTIPVRAAGAFSADRSSDLKRLRRGRPIQQPGADDDAPHNWAVAVANGTTSKQQGYKGTEVFISVWQPYVESPSEFSLAQLWLIGTKINASSGGQITETIEVGWQCYAGFYGDGRPRLFVFWTSESYLNGCYDLECSGFVQVSNKVLLAGSFTPISKVSGQQYEIKILVFKDNGTGDWWLQLNDENVGYWPQDLYSSLNVSADYIGWGGEIVDDYEADGGPHTKTDMGSGEFASKGRGRAAYQRNLQYVDDNKRLVDAPFHVLDDTRTCYSAAIGKDLAGWRSYFFFGGTGRNRHCLKN